MFDKNFEKSFVLELNPELYVKDPQSTKLGKLILTESIIMIHSEGIEVFTFKKLAVKINSTEASIYRYFENKHMLLIYLTNWYWRWLEYRLVFGIYSIENYKQKLLKGVELVTSKIDVDNDFNFIDEVKLNEIVINEGSKTYLTSYVEADNKKGFFTGYKSLVNRLSDLIMIINPNYKYPHMLISTIIEGAHHQRYFAQYLPRLTDINKEEEDSIVTFYKEMILKLVYNEK